MNSNRFGRLWWTWERGLGLEFNAGGLDCEALPVATERNDSLENSLVGASTFVDGSSVWVPWETVEFKMEVYDFCTGKPYPFAHKNVAPILQEHWKEQQCRRTHSTRTLERTTTSHPSYKTMECSNKKLVTIVLDFLNFFFVLTTSPSSHQTGYTTVSKPAISFLLTLNQLTWLMTTAPPGPLARRPKIPPFFVLAKKDWCITLNLLRTEAPSLKSALARDNFMKLTVDSEAEHIKLKTTSSNRA
ncbi:hypothetical protein CEXT_718351 [Caerostris extrusa]|uniref:Uncharacterized protein n=1 Tax=Caerostris extrusa TaxID=172846 RepID=A0AAV4XPH7_CAEEX|nr:hypothetical protein CEXT_718351 [Caerostris extrusa]